MQVPAETAHALVYYSYLLYFYFIFTLKPEQWSKSLALYLTYVIQYVGAYTSQYKGIITRHCKGPYINQPVQWNARTSLSFNHNVVMSRKPSFHPHWSGTKYPPDAAIQNRQVAQRIRQLVMPVRMPEMWLKPSRIIFVNYHCLLSRTIRVLYNWYNTKWK